MVFELMDSTQKLHYESILNLGVTKTGSQLGKVKGIATYIPKINNFKCLHFLQNLAKFYLKYPHTHIYIHTSFVRCHLEGLTSSGYLAH